MARIKCPLSEAAQISRHRPAILSPDGVLRFGELDKCVRTTADLLYRAGVREGDRVGVAMSVEWRYPIVVLALLRLGAVTCAIDAELGAAARRMRLASVGCRIAVVSGGRASGEKGLIEIDAEKVAGVVYETSPRMEVPHLDLERPATIHITGTKTPLAIMHTLGNHYYGARGANVHLPLHSDDRWLFNVAPHMVTGFGILMRCLLSGATLVFAGEDETFEKALRHYGVTCVSLTVKDLERFIHTGAQAQWYPDLRRIIVRGTVEPAELLEEAERRGFRIYQGYGLAEMASLVTGCSRHAGPEERRTCGRVMKYRDVRIGEDGRIYVRGKTLFRGYVTHDRVELPLDAEGWFATEDFGTVDADGCLTVVRRGSPGEW